MSDEPVKVCTGCNQYKPATTEYFYTDKSRKSGLTQYCKLCQHERDRKRYQTRSASKIQKHHMMGWQNELKYCPICKQEKPRNDENFHHNKSRKDGLHIYCKTCQAIRSKELREKHKDHKKDYSRQYYLHNAMILREYSRRYYYLHIDRCTRRRQEYTKNHLEETRLYQQIYRQTHKMERGIYDRIRKARKMNIAGSHTPQQIREQYKNQKGRCYYCRERVKWGQHHIDHTFPVSRVVGTDIPANDISYLVITCKSCNLKKHDKFPWEWPEGGRLL